MQLSTTLNLVSYHIKIIILKQSMNIFPFPPHVITLTAWVTETLKHLATYAQHSHLH